MGNRDRDVVEFRLLMESYDGQFGHRRVGLPTVLELMLGPLVWLILGYNLVLIREWQSSDYCIACALVGVVWSSLVGPWFVCYLCPGCGLVYV